MLWLSIGAPGSLWLGSTKGPAALMIAVSSSLPLVNAGPTLAAGVSKAPITHFTVYCILTLVFIRFLYLPTKLFGRHHIVCHLNLLFKNVSRGRAMSQLLTRPFPSKLEGNKWKWARAVMCVSEGHCCLSSSWQYWRFELSRLLLRAYQMAPKLMFLSRYTSCETWNSNYSKLC